MGFSCDIDEGPEFFSTRDVTARKPHVCCECAETIEQGATYRRDTVKWKGDFGQYDTCERCSDLRDSYVGLGYCYYYGDLWGNHLDMLMDSGRGESPAAEKARDVIEKCRRLRHWRRVGRHRLPTDELRMAGCIDSGLAP